MIGIDKRSWQRIALALFVAGAALVAWQSFQPRPGYEGLTSGNGRIEAVEIDIATKIPGRIRDILVDEGDFVAAGQVLADGALGHS